MTYHFWVTVTLILISYLVSRIHIVSGKYLLYYWDRNPKIGVWMHLWISECHIPFTGHCDLEL